MNRTGICIAALLIFAGCQTVPKTTNLAECDTKTRSKACLQTDIEAIRDVRQDIEKVRRVREKRS
jgi:uncharacterized lipoprotein YajG